MRSPAAAFAWEFGRRHRWGWVAVAGYLLLMAAGRLLMLDPWQPVEIDPALFAATTFVPLWSATVYLVAVFSFGLAGDMAARQSMYPTRFFTLPVTTAALASWPMLYGVAAVAGLWVAGLTLAPWPKTLVVPVSWPPLFAAVFLAWVQVLAWMPSGLPGLRVILAILWLAAIDAVVFVAIEYRVPDYLMLALLAPQLPLASVFARGAVAKARRGHVPDWRGAWSRSGTVANLLPRGRHEFASAARAQRWFEWRRHGLALPAWVGIVLPFELALLFLAPDRQELVLSTLLGVLMTPPFVAAFTAPSARTSRPRAGDTYGLTPFMATRPLTSAAMAGAKLRMAIGTTLAAWLLVAAAIPAALAASGTWPTVAERAGAFVAAVGMPRAIAATVLGLLALVASTWKQVVQALGMGLTGREWIVKSSVFLRLSMLVFVVPFAGALRTGSGVAALWDALPWVLGGLVGLKMSLAAWVATRLWRTRLVDDRTLVAGAAIWCVVVLALYGVLVWLVSTPPFVPRHLPAMVAILAVPLVRGSATPLALEWNRRR
jgi:hypothetical protein